MIKYFDPTSRVYELFNSIQTDNIEIIDIQYQANIKHKMTVLKETVKYFPSIFTYFTENDEDVLVYKRVSNYNKMKTQYKLQ